MHKWLGIAAVLASVACGNGGTSSVGPTGLQLPLQAGTYTAQFFGADAVGGGAEPIRPGCPGIAAAGNTVFTRMRMELDGDDWTARAQDGTSSVTIRMRRGEGRPQLPRVGTRIVVTIAGIAHNTSSATPGDDTGRTISFGTTAGAGASLEGVLPPTDDMPAGTIIGDVAFVGSNGVSVSCNSGTVSWSLSLRGN
jgi:hypothetical protein